MRAEHSALQAAQQGGSATEINSDCREDSSWVVELRRRLEQITSDIEDELRAEKRTSRTETLGIRMSSRSRLQTVPWIARQQVNNREVLLEILPNLRVDQF